MIIKSLPDGGGASFISIEILDIQITEERCSHLLQHYLNGGHIILCHTYQDNTVTASLGLFETIPSNCMDHNLYSNPHHCCKYL